MAIVTAPAGQISHNSEIFTTQNTICQAACMHRRRGCRSELHAQDVYLLRSSKLVLYCHLQKQCESVASLVWQKPSCLCWLLLQDLLLLLLFALMHYSR
jgi:hypothetical protein